VRFVQSTFLGISYISLVHVVVGFVEKAKILVVVVFVKINCRSENVNGNKISGIVLTRVLQ
jgi:hypothetical protein